LVFKLSLVYPTSNFDNVNVSFSNQTLLLKDEECTCFERDSLLKYFSFFDKKKNLTKEFKVFFLFKKTFLYLRLRMSTNKDYFFLSHF
jgi:hypothetical protein